MPSSVLQAKPTYALSQRELFQVIAQNALKLAILHD